MKKVGKMKSHGYFPENFVQEILFQWLRYLSHFHIKDNIATVFVSNL